MSDNKRSPKSNNKIVPSSIDNSNEVWDRHSNMPKEMMKRWFGGGPQVDKEITDLFKADLVDIGQGNLRHWQGDKDGKLAALILCD